MANTGLPTYNCPVHGYIKTWTIEIVIDEERLGVRCMRCFNEALDRIGVSRATPTGETVSISLGSHEFINNSVVSQPGIQSAQPFADHPEALQASGDTVNLPGDA